MLILGCILMALAVPASLAAVTQPLWRRQPRNYSKEALVCILVPLLTFLPGALLIHYASH